MSELLKVAMNAFEKRLTDGVLNITRDKASQLNEATNRLSAPNLVSEILAQHPPAQRKTLVDKFLRGATPRNFSERVQNLRNWHSTTLERRQDKVHDMIATSQGTPNIYPSTKFPGAPVIGRGNEGRIDMEYSRHGGGFVAVKEHSNQSFLGGKRTQGEAIKAKHELAREARATYGDNSGFPRSLGYDLTGPTPRSMSQYIHGGDAEGRMGWQPTNLMRTLKEKGFFNARRRGPSGEHVGATYLKRTGEKAMTVQDAHPGNFIIDGQKRDFFVDPLVTKGEKPLDVNKGIPLDDYSEAYDIMRRKG